jgi:hypothetical protein
MLYNFLLVVKYLKAGGKDLHLAIDTATLWGLYVADIQRFCYQLTALPIRHSYLQATNAQNRTGINRPLHFECTLRSYLFRGCDPLASFVMCTSPLEYLSTAGALNLPGISEEG